MIEKIQELISRQKELEEELASPIVTSNPTLLEKLGREYNSLKKNMPEYHRYVDMVKNCADNKELLATEADLELRQMAKEEIDRIERSFRHWKRK